MTRPLPAQQPDCPAAAAPAVTAGWEAYGRGDMAAAARAFDAALRSCPRDAGAATGAGYVALRRDQLGTAKRRFDEVLARDPDVVDALVGRGMVAWREAEPAAARGYFTRAVALQPGHAEATAYLARLPAPAAAVERPPLVLPDSVTYPARTHGDRFEVRTATGWTPFYIRGMNLGAALPGKHASEFPDSLTYARWLADIAAMGVNALRVYTIHPPHFYQALAAHNAAHPAAPLWLVHGVWAELPPKHDFDQAQWRREYYGEMRRVVDVLHGRADVEARPGHAHGSYSADVSPWVLAYIIGREWEPFALQAYEKLRPGRTTHAGRYLRLDRGSPANVWLAEACDALIAYEMERYRAQRPIAYTNWPTTDPLRHPGETTVAQEVALRRAMGERAIVPPREYDNDAVALDPGLVRATAEFPAGWFASYHAYPYYPDFMLYQPEYAAARSSEGASSYFGYLRALKQHHRGLPVLIAEYGVPASIGSAHLQTQGWHHGGLTESAMAEIDARMTREIAEAGMAGGMLFAWIDEWFKKNWLVMEFEVPAERNRLWYNRLDAEQHYGMVALEAEPPLAGNTFAARASAWDAVAPLYADPRLRVRAAHDAAYLWLHVELPARPALLEVGFDVLEPGAGERAWPGGGAIPVGIEFLLRATPDTVRLLADQRANPFLIVPVAENLRTAARPPPASYPLPGFFAGRFEMRLNRPFATVVNGDGLFTPLLVLPNRRRVLPDSTDVQAHGYDRGVLPLGEPPDGLAQWGDAGRILEVRIPWLLLNVTDPSGRRVLRDAPGRTTGEFGTTAVRGLGIVARALLPESSVQLPTSAAASDVAYYGWNGWEQPTWRARVRPVYDVMRRTFAALDPVVMR